MLWKKRVSTFRGLCFFSRAGKNRVHKKWGFFTAILPHVWESVFFSELKFSDSSLRHFLLFAGARVLDIASWHPMALYSAPDQTF